MRTTLRRLLLLFCALRYGARLLWQAAPPDGKVHWIAIFVTRLHRSPNARGLLHRALPQLGPLADGLVDALAGAFAEGVAAQSGEGMRTLHDALEFASRTETALTTPLTGEEMPTALRAALGRPLDEVFAWIDWTPLETGIGMQAHAARLREPPPDKRHGEVVVKLLRRGQVERIEDDVAVLRWLAALLERLFPAARELRLHALAQSFSGEVMRRFDLRAEAANLSQTGRHFADDARIAVPDVVWAYSTDYALVTERLETLPVGDLPDLARHGVDLERLAVNLLEVTVEQAFEHGFFHTVMSERHVRVSVGRDTLGRIVLADCSLMSSLTEPEREFFVHGATALFGQDYGTLAGMHHEVGHVAPDTRPERLEAELRTRSEPHFARPSTQRRAGGLLRHLVEAVKPFEGAVPPVLALAGHSLERAESLARMLAPELDTWRIAQASLGGLARKNVDHRGWLKHLARELPHLAPVVPRLPLLLVNRLQSPREHRIGVDTVRRLREIAHEQRRTRRLLWACAVTGALLGVALVWFA
ncbi:AarF/UbiB family protein [Trinickia caryophylli]|nr:AarF/UbiB family protein [Trinickia caryophylli]PMS13041.1 ABC transporter [Trinickia caryophylli]TRX14803.1 ABC transporter [Trinickia caryophylli]WQE14649.1 AarF/UbiB family protein [Trinickia caryophylli]